MKCPFCQQELEEDIFFRGRVFVSCNNPNCILFDWGGCSKQTIIELMRTRKALEIIKKEMSKETMPDFAVIHNVLKTALERKESAFVHNKIEFPEYNDNLLEEFDKQFFENGQDDDLTETALERKDNQ